MSQYCSELTHLVNVQPQVPGWEKDVRDWLGRQPKSLGVGVSVDDAIQLVRDGIWHVTAVLAQDEIVGIIVYSVGQAPMGICGATIHFWSCENFFAMMSAWGTFESYLMHLGVEHIEAAAHPAIAHYAQRKLGFKSPAIHICKTLAREGVH